MLKFGLFNGRLLADSGVLKKIDDKVDTSGIIETAKSLACIYTLKEKHTTDFSPYHPTRFYKN
jgi:hypothetical protein